MNRPFQLSDPKRARQLADAIAILAPPAPIKIVHVCGTHEMAITQNGLRRFLPDKVEVLEGPGCPVCVTPTADIDAAFQIAEAGAVLCTFGDMTRVPGTRLTLEQARSKGCDIRVVLSAADAVNMAEETDREVVFFAVGFETTTPMTAAVLLDAPPENFSVLVSHKKIPEAMAVLLDLPGTNISGYLAPGHVSTIIGLAPYERHLAKFNIPIVVGGFEPLDILYAVALILRQIRDGKGVVENGFPRAVSDEGNTAAQVLIEAVFESTEVQWRGIGAIPDSGYRLRQEFAQFDARERFHIEGETAEEEIPGCRCADVLTARATPGDCPLFGTRCTPLSPVGPCMVGTEGACSISFRYGGRELP
ncbi:hydrogenase formation protein HypD [Candidatus Bipolaricaulota bacterium]|nr:hydrogenase formation protein HypD [Candidatus Bipolaricaulota bacterium]